MTQKITFTLVLILLVHLILLGAYPIYGGLSILYQHYSMVYRSDYSVPGYSPPSPVDCSSLTTEQCTKERTLREQELKEVIDSEKQNVKQYLPRSIFENGSMILLGLLSILGVIGLVKHRRWAAIILILVTAVFLLQWLPQGFLGLPFTVVAFFLGLALLIFIPIEFIYIKRHWTELS